MTEEVKTEIPEIEPPKVEQPEEVSVDVKKDDEDDQKPIFNKYQVRDAVKREQKKAYERGKREALMELQQQQQQATQAQQPPAAQAANMIPSQAPQQASSLGGIQQMSPDDIRKMISEEAPRALQEHANALQQKQIVDSFVSKMQAAEAKYPGLEQKLNELDYSTIAPLIKMANEMENTGDIMNELIENPMKMGNLVSLLYTQPKLAAKAIQNLSSSIKSNADAATQEKSVKEPFSQFKPSNNASKDDGNLTTADYRKQSWLRG